MVFALATLLSALLCGIYLWWARRLQLLAEPDHRSSHSAPTPHGGGVGLICAFVISLLLLQSFQGQWHSAYLVLAGCAVLLMLLGILDDLRGLAIAPRLLLYLLISLASAAWLLQPLWSMGAGQALVLTFIAAFGLLSLLNIYNFMDGIDGIAALQAIVAGAAAAVIASAAGAPALYVGACGLLAACHLGFLLWNWPPAKMFMGDAGSVATGYLLGALALLGAVQGYLPLACWLVLLAVFITDAGWTLAWRIVTGQRFTEPHRMHAYQRLSRRWGSHLKVDVLLLFITLTWSVPIAWAVHANPDHALFLVILAYLPLLGFMAKMRSMT